MRSPRIRTFCAATLVIAAVPGLAGAQPGALDRSFNPDANQSVFAVSLLGDGNMLLGGNFGRVGGQLRDYTARITSGGSLDTGFANAQPNGVVRAMAVQPDGKVLIAGQFTRIGGQDRDRVARLNADGTHDTTFVDPNVDAAVYALALQPDGKVLIGGLFTTVGGLQMNYVARLNSDGTRDTNFRRGKTGSSPARPSAAMRRSSCASSSAAALRLVLRCGSCALLFFPAR